MCNIFCTEIMRELYTPGSFLNILLNHPKTLFLLVQLIWFCWYYFTTIYIKSDKDDNNKPCPLIILFRYIIYQLPLYLYIAYFLYNIYKIK